MKPIDPAGFERKFRGEIDPWDYTTSRFEAYKRRALLHACGCHTYGRGLELACAIGETTRFLAPRCLRLLAVDSSPTALAEARRRTTGLRGVTIRRALLPRETPRGPFDLIVGSEIAYYMSPNDLKRLLRRLCNELAKGGTIVFLHHLRRFDDAAQPPALVHARITASLRQSMRIVYARRYARFDVLAFRKRLH
jgi:cyclopropane fatty-acyl-phospholipid synthase-like methyltransferase